MAMQACQIGPTDTAPLVQDRFIGPASEQEGTLWGRQPFCFHFSTPYSLVWLYSPMQIHGCGLIGCTLFPPPSGESRVTEPTTACKQHASIFVVARLSPSDSIQQVHILQDDVYLLLEHGSVILPITTRILSVQQMMLIPGGMSSKARFVVHYVLSFFSLCSIFFVQAPPGPRSNPG